ncbi:MAG: acetyl-CoA carboxylase carboxyltransferase subunit alpha [Lentisphaeria bacterium]|jgi:acetyl-CoA carboxylase carboxyl transferase subunit alpha|nr:acetyl-CoA carboxylase carboxyltransferase subunit alpha [Lentisphaeria bacterium]MDY0175744.1 acetyl-CoA carboxylase carboxyltransferase subunit alpha [Lentisphaeria bacterium]NLZ59200.1 acetyl-CoA carboxylase carboxyltransferase subunit alpha [Lentisphaerota bacterium]
MISCLEIEKPILELECKLAELSASGLKRDADLNSGILLLREKLGLLKEHFFLNLSPIEKVQMARHPQRPYPADYISLLFSDFLEFHGDRRYSDDQAIFGGFALFDQQPVMLIATRKGRDLKSNMACNFGCAHPEGYRKALRLMHLADKVGAPIITLVDTPGAYPGIGAEERHIGEAIACNLRDMFALSVPVISVITGEGGSGGALGISVANRLLVMANSYYSVITPEGCAAILWRNSEAVPKAAEALKLTSDDLKKLKVADEVVREPAEGAHRDYQKAAELLGEALLRHLQDLRKMSAEQLRQDRHEKFRQLGLFLE